MIVHSLSVIEKALIITIMTQRGSATAREMQIASQVDRHLCSEYLDELRSKGILRVAQIDRDGMTRYEVNRTNR